jgi:hypothetical protein
MKKRAITITALVLLASLAPITHTVTVDVIVKPRIKTKATWEDKKKNKAMAMSFAKAGWGWDKTQRDCIMYIFTKESRFDHLAKNQQGSSAYGIAQMLKEKSKDPAIQILKAYKYIEHRYETPCKAWNHHKRKNWY